jgi:hypothetical protein
MDHPFPGAISPRAHDYRGFLTQGRRQPQGLYNTPPLTFGGGGLSGKPITQRRVIFVSLFEDLADMSFRLDIPPQCSNSLPPARAFVWAQRKPRPSFEVATLHHGSIRRPNLFIVPVRSKGTDFGTMVQKAGQSSQSSQQSSQWDDAVLQGFLAIIVPKSSHVLNRPKSGTIKAPSSQTPSIIVANFWYHLRQWSLVISNAIAFPFFVMIHLRIAVSTSLSFFKSPSRA